MVSLTLEEISRIDERIHYDAFTPDHRPDLGSCWIFDGIDDHGYGQFRVGRAALGGGMYRVHRLMYELLIGPIPKGLEIDHLCRVRACCNPAHLEVVTHGENGRRGYGPVGINTRRTHCVNGHEFTPENTYRKPSGERQCRACNNAASLRYQRRKRDR